MVTKYAVMGKDPGEKYGGITGLALHFRHLLTKNALCDMIYG